MFGGIDDDLLVRRIGLITFERPGGNCYWYQDGDDPKGQFRNYVEFLDDDWHLARIFAIMATTCGCFLLMITLTMCCSSHCMAVRSFSTIMLGVVLPVYQSLTFLVFTSELCKDQECTFSRSSGWSVGAATCYLGSGFCHVIMKDYPGEKALREKARTTSTLKESDPAYTQEQAPVEVEVEDEDASVEVVAALEEGDLLNGDDDTSGVAAMTDLGSDEEEEVVFETPEDEVLADNGNGNGNEMEPADESLMADDDTRTSKSTENLNSAVSERIDIMEEEMEPSMRVDIVDHGKIEN